MYQRVIIGIDRAHRARDVIAAAKAFTPGAELHLVSVFPYPAVPESPVHEEYEAALRKETLERLAVKRTVAELPTAELHAIADTSAAEGLKRFAAEQDADLIVIGAGHRGPLGRMLGDVARGVLHGAPCAVLVAPDDLAAAPVPTREIGVAFDDTLEANHALAVAARLAAERGASLHVIQALDIGVTPAVWGFQVASYLRDLVAPAQERLDEIIKGLPVPARGSVVQGPTAAVLVEAAKHVDLMVCGSRGWGPASRLAFGSNADRLMHHAACPVLVVPRSADAEPEGAEPATAPDAAAVPTNG